jgi:hypothetical protein
LKATTRPELRQKLLGEQAEGEDEAAGSGEDEAAFRRGDGAAQFPGGFNPLADDHFDVGQGLAVRVAVRRAALEFRNLGNEGPVFRAPVK